MTGAPLWVRLFAPCAAALNAVSVLINVGAIVMEPRYWWANGPSAIVSGMIGAWCWKTRIR